MTQLSYTCIETKTFGENSLDVFSFDGFERRIVGSFSNDDNGFSFALLSMLWAEISSTGLRTLSNLPVRLRRTSHLPKDHPMADVLG